MISMSYFDNGHKLPDLHLTEIVVESKVLLNGDFSLCRRDTVDVSDDGQAAREYIFTLVP